MGSGGNNRAQRAAERAEAERQQQISSGTAELNRIFGSPERERQIGDVLDATREKFMMDLDRQKVDTDRNLKFAMARGGLSGGSLAADKGREVGETYIRGRTEAERKAQGVASDIRLTDQASKQNLLAMIQSGLDMNTASMQATQSLQNNLASARSGASMGALDNMFGMFGDLWTQSRENDVRRRTARDYNTLYSRDGGGGR